MKKKIIFLSLMSLLFVPTVKAEEEVEVERPCIGCYSATYIFETNGGNSINSCSLTSASPHCLDSNNDVVVPSDGVLPIPTKEGYTFDGWYNENEFTTKVNKLSDVTVDIVNGYINESTIYAKWNKNEIVNKTDTKTNVSIQMSISQNSQDIELNVSNILENSSEYTKITSLIKASKYKIFDIKLMQQNTVVQPNGQVKIIFDIPSNFNSSKIIVYRVNDDNTTTELSYTISNGKLEVLTDHFSYYVIAEVGTQTSVDSESNIEVDTKVETKVETTVETTTKVESTIESTTEQVVEEEQVENPDTGENIIYTTILALIVMAAIMAIYTKLNKKVRN